MRDWSPDEPAPAEAAPPPSTAPPGETPSNLRVPAHAGPLGQLAIGAALAARVGHCDTARTAMHAIARNDLDYYQDVVSSEPAIAACLR
jgi:hypothetical protein